MTVKMTTHMTTTSLSGRLPWTFPPRVPVRNLIISGIFGTQLRVQEGDQRTYWNNPLTDIKVTAEIGGETISVPQYGSEDALNAEI